MMNTFVYTIYVRFYNLGIVLLKLKWKKLAELDNTGKMPSNCPAPNWFHGLGTPQKCCLPRDPIAMVTKKFAVSHDAMLNYLSQWEVTEYFGRKKTSYFSIIQVMDNFFSI